MKSQNKYRKFQLQQKNIEALEILSYWRTSHASALESAFDLLENITNKKPIKYLCPFFVFLYKKSSH